MQTHQDFLTHTSSTPYSAGQSAQTPNYPSGKGASAAHQTVPAPSEFPLANADFGNCLHNQGSAAMKHVFSTSNIPPDIYQ